MEIAAHISETRTCPNIIRCVKFWPL